MRARRPRSPSRPSTRPAPDPDQRDPKIDSLNDDLNPLAPEPTRPDLADLVAIRGWRAEQDGLGGCGETGGYGVVASSGSIPMSSSRSGQWSARPPSMISRLACWRGEPPASLGNQPTGTLNLPAIEERHHERAAGHMRRSGSRIDGDRRLIERHALAPTLQDIPARTARRPVGRARDRWQCTTRAPSPSQGRARTRRSHHRSARAHAAACGCRCSRSTRSTGETERSAEDRRHWGSRAVEVGLAGLRLHGQDGRLADFTPTCGSPRRHTPATRPAR